MFWALIGVISLHLVAGGALPKSAVTTSHRSIQQQASSTNAPYDAEAERQLLALANAERSRVGLLPLKVDDGLARAARAHAAEMATQNRIAHQFSGEPALPQRLAASSPLHLESTGENVAMAGNPEQAHQALMASPPHRDNLLSPNFNVAGFGVFRSGTMIYVAQDFASSLPSYSVQQAQELVSTSVEKLRAQAKMSRLQRVDSGSIQSSACAMAQADSLNAAVPPPGAYMLRYTSMAPETLPSDISKVIAARGLHTYSAGTCYAKTQKYPNGAYWVVLIFH
jgi:uncharacterized protein YkwD